MGATPRLLAGRARAAQCRPVPRSALRSLEVTPASLRKEPAGVDEDEHGERIDPLIVASMRRYRFRSASAPWGSLVLTSLPRGSPVVGVVAGLVGGAWVSVPSSWSELWGAAWSGWVPRRRRLRRWGRSADDPPGAAERARAAMGVTPGARRDVPACRFDAVASMVAWVPSRSLTSSLRGPLPCCRSPGRLAPALLVSATHGVLASVLAHVALSVCVAYCAARGPAPARRRRRWRHAAPPRPARRQRRLRRPGGCRSVPAAPPWTLAGVVALTWRSRRRALLAAAPALVLRLPTYVSIAAHPRRGQRSPLRPGACTPTRAPPRGWRFWVMPAAPSSSLRASRWAPLVPALSPPGARAPAAVAFPAALLRAARSWPQRSAGRASQVGVGLSGAFVATAWTAPALSLVLWLAVLCGRSGWSAGDRPRPPAALGWPRPFPARALGALTALALLAVGAPRSPWPPSRPAGTPRRPRPYVLAQRATVSARGVADRLRRRLAGPALASRRAHPRPRRRSYGRHGQRAPCGAARVPL